ncbi:MAG: IS630 family transposase [Okeania sp. SIO2H7]|nr:IS630 family transposase [Okeania sp. SIO2H7]
MQRSDFRATLRYFGARYSGQGQYCYYVSFFTEAQTQPQKKTTHAPKANTDKVQLERVEYWQKIAPNDIKNLVFLDETGIQLSIAQRYARSQRGERALGTAPYPHGNMITLIGAIKFDGVVTTMTVEDGTNSNVFRTFVEEMLVPQLWEGACVVADNLRAHYAPGVKEAIESVGAKLIYLSPYSPDFNPIEHWWSQSYCFFKESQTTNQGRVRNCYF